MKNNKKPMLIAVSGIKNSGKTTLITKLIPRLIDLGYKVATIKHDGHDFQSDIEGTDSYKHKEAGAYGSAIFSKTKFMIVKEQNQISENELFNYFPEADIILLEGFKYSDYPKIEVVRKGISKDYIGKKESLIAIVTDLECKFEGIKTININNIGEIIEVLLNECKEVQ
ncbi:molybdopterin-guanine dinucleotide biosynthesis protein B [Clostridium saccharobutylicum]|uniref:Molybdopterin-guanine dinucleotide biosynthesis protein B n=1 Tax=Clostridium saccharobutylicum DSM 13864 TaxID=1345695 RepID=U5MVE5_CLOSA|nr:molybdopterin-guanine dinucleotide biosynthesis protein B [Clostridium saccharobutylicum]AGX43616.1 molybdopterin-guanine dinucleotide biosynthesis protein B [Clostridium saccharobutylicum DSM 13864]AQR90914.1 molybdopterin-guanine dinucleotide biosynthesis adapter protein [Clostridium saccharobutylicum]AQS00818.1 molybdopterin-guanine dinucleotide biosynthesis adapter protein [Clostridium saccharobutylicum]AQS10481.1 molybdopterin-guanine dinucleotide biosynthesis adapter protein [Clostridi